MNEKKNIDRLFQEKFRDFEVAPDEKVWLDIEAKLKEKKKRRVIPLWWKLSGVAAVLLIGLLVFGPFSNSGNSHPNPDGVVNTDDGNTNAGNGSENNDTINPSTGSSNSGTNSGIANSGSSSDKTGLTPTPDKSVAETATDTDNIPNEREIVTNPQQVLPNLPQQKTKKSFKAKQTDAFKNADNAIAASSEEKKSGSPASQKTVRPDQGVAVNEKPSTSQGLSPVGDGQNHLNTSQPKTTNDKLEVQTPQNTGIAANNANVKTDSAAVATADPNVLEELLNEKENSVTSREQKINRWQITSNVAPIYFSSVSNGSPLDSRFEGNKKSYVPSLSYGVGAKYEINDRFSIKSGVNAVALEYNTNGIVFFQTDNARMIENVKPNIAGSFIQVETMPENNAVTTMSRERNQYNGEVKQKIGYVEIPVEMTYKLIDKKFGMELIGGMSTLILNQNEVSLLSPGMDMQIGEASNLNPVHFSTNVGVGFKYNFLKSFQANVEPMLKYQINTFSNDSGNFKPFFFGLYTGVSYRF